MASMTEEMKDMALKEMMELSRTVEIIELKSTGQDEAP